MAKKDRQQLQGDREWNLQFEDYCRHKLKEAIAAEDHELAAKLRAQIDARADS